MANLLWGKVYYKNLLAGIIKEEPEGGVSFKYDNSYLNSSNPQISYNIPLSDACYTDLSGLMPFFDNLVADGWLADVQTKFIGSRKTSKLQLLLSFGYDCAGAVSIIDPEPQELIKCNNTTDKKELAVINSCSSLSGIHPKLAVVKRNNKYYPAKSKEVSTHIAKFSSENYPDLIENEFLATAAFKKLLPNEDVVDLSIGQVEGISSPALIIKRFDRLNGDKIHFEEFNQLLNIKSANRCNGSYKQMGDFIFNDKSCVKVEAYRLYGRILAGLIVGNSNMHLKDFAMLHTPQGLRLSPCYDISCSMFFDHKKMALAINDIGNLLIESLQAENIAILGNDFNLSKDAVFMLIKQLRSNIDTAKNAVSESNVGSIMLKNSIIKLMDSIWNKVFDSIGRL